MRGVPTWRRIMQNEGEDPGRNAAERVYQQPRRWANQSDHISCSKCGAWRRLGNGTLLNATGQAHIVCHNCKLRTRSKTWKCRCNIEWSNCETHSILLPQIVEQNRRRRAYLAAIKRQRYNKRERDPSSATTTQQYEIRLSQQTRLRFAHLLNRSSNDQPATNDSDSSAQGTDTVNDFNINNAGTPSTYRELPNGAEHS